MSRYVLLSVYVSVVLLLPLAALATYTFVSPPNEREQVTFDDLSYRQDYYGSLEGFPHTYTFVLDATNTVSFLLREPKLNSNPRGVGGILVRVLPLHGVTEVARLKAGTDGYRQSWDLRTSDRYVRSASFTGELAPGPYLFEVNTADNQGRYRLTVNSDAPSLHNGYFETLREVRAVKQFLGKSVLSVLWSPFYALPLLAFLAALAWWWRGWRFFKQQNA